MLNEIKAALNQWYQDTKYISKVAPSDWGKRAHAEAAKRVTELHIKIDAYEAQKIKELKEALATLADEKDNQIAMLKAQLEAKNNISLDTKKKIAQPPLKQ